MAPLQPALVESDPTAMVSAVQRRVRRRALVVLLTDLNASALDEGLIAGAGFAVHLLWIAAIVFFVFWLAGFAFARGQRNGRRRR